MTLATLGTPELVLAGATVLASIIGSAGAITAAVISKGNREHINAVGTKLDTPGPGTIGQKVQAVAEDQNVADVKPAPRAP